MREIRDGTIDIDHYSLMKVGVVIIEPTKVLTGFEGAVRDPPGDS